MGNCLAVGLSQGFIEPLEATAYILCRQRWRALSSVTKPASATDLIVKLPHRYEGIRDYIVGHYRLNRRTDTPYWRDNAANHNLSDNLKTLMTSWFRGEDLSATVADLDISQYYSSLSWHCLFAGYGIFPPDEKIMPPGDDIAQIDMDAIDDFWTRCAMNYGDHKALLDALHTS